MTCENKATSDVRENRLSALRRLTTVDEVETTVGRPASAIMLKQISTLDEGCRTVLARCPVAAFGYRDADGTSRTTFIGGTPGFARVHSPTRISFSLPEPGDPYGPVSLFFLLPGVGEILRVNGSVAARKGAETTVDIAEAYVHCAQAVLRSRLWQPPTRPSRPATPAAEFTVTGPCAGPASPSSWPRRPSSPCPPGTRPAGATPVRAGTGRRWRGSWTAARSSSRTGRATNAPTRSTTCCRTTGFRSPRSSRDAAVCCTSAAAARSPTIPRCWRRWRCAGCPRTWRCSSTSSTPR
jgi:hypothetical protein